MPKGQCHDYTQDQKLFIKAHHQLPRKDLATLFNQAFNTNLKPSALGSYCKRHELLTGRDGQFEAGGKPWNTGTVGVCKPNSGSFKKGDSPLNQKDFGHERICCKDGYALVKVDEINPHTGYRGRYRAKHRVIWEKEHGEIPEGMVIRFIDGDKLNCDINNLACIPMSVNARLNKSKINTLPTELRGTAIAIARLEDSISRAQSRK